jgi:hypothetical protein
MPDREADREVIRRAESRRQGKPESHDRGNVMIFPKEAHPNFEIKQASIEAPLGCGVCMDRLQ